MKPILRLLALSLLLAGAPAPAREGVHWARTWAASPQEAPSQPSRPVPDLADRTIRQIVRVSAGGDRLRLLLSNEMSPDPLVLDDVHVALAAADGAIVPGSDHAVTFGGAREARFPAGAPLLSDAVPLRLPALARIAVSIHVPAAVAHPTVHPLGRATGYIVPGSHGGDVALPGAAHTEQRLFLTGVDTSSAQPARVVVAVGDSITDGARATVNADLRWPDQLAARLQKRGYRGIAVANAGISGNRILKYGAGPALLARFDRDVLSVPGVRAIVLLEGINDIGSAAREGRPTPSPATIIAGMRQVIDRAHDHGIKVFGATITPYKGASYYSVEGEGARTAVNDWILHGHAFDGTFDFDRAVRDPADPQHLAPDKDGGDALHPSDAGYRAMAEAVDLAAIAAAIG